MDDPRPDSLPRDGDDERASRRLDDLLAASNAQDGPRRPPAFREADAFRPAPEARPAFRGDAAFREDRRCAHDPLAKTVVVKDAA